MKIAFKDSQQLNQLFQIRLIILCVLSLAMIFILLSRYYYLQILSGETYRTQSDSNRIHGRAIPPVRGLIADRNGLLLAKNTPNFELHIIPDHSKDLDNLLQDISKIISLTTKEKAAFLENPRLKYRSYLSIPLKDKLTEKQVAQLAINEYRLPGMSIKSVLSREYPLEEKAAHSIGYVGQINLEEQKDLDPKAYDTNHLIGKIGLEKQYELQLLGQVGYEYVEADVTGRVHRHLSRNNAINGSNLELYLDSQLQTFLYQLLKNERASAVAIEVETGGILAITSTPSFNPSQLVQGISHIAFNKIINNPDKPMFNRSTSGLYPPGSIIKPIFAIAGLEQKVVTEKTQINDTGFIQVFDSDRYYRDWKREGHGMVNLMQAIMQSCDVFFYKMGLSLGIKRLQKYASMFGIGQKTGIDLPQEKKGFIPSANIFGWSDGDTVNVSIGQGDLLVTPLQMAQYTAILARKGQIIPPKLIKSIDNKVLSNPAVGKINLQKNSVWEYIEHSMIGVVHHSKGTAFTLNKNSQYKIASKTGTAQLVSIEQGEEYDTEKLQKKDRDHAWFIAYAPIKNPKIAIAIIIENGESGSRSAGVVAVKAINSWLNSQQDNG